MTTEIYWLVLTTVVTAIFWVPYVLNRIAVRGLLRAIGNPQASDKPHSPWAERALLAHQNAIENLIIFASLILAAHAAGVSNSITEGAAALYFLARVGHYFVYVFGIPGARTLTFATGWLCQMAIGLTLLGVI